ncbi:ribokinase [Erysipelothrix sp. P66]|uniref:ribokinase n=1 Tax=Erysipelothrix sp. P66 TaxID=3141531 RepID=UPI00315D0E38
MKVLNFGSMNIDNVYYLDRFVQPGETKDVRKLEVNPGGKGLNQSIAMRRAGIDVCHAGILGNGGNVLKEYLEENEVDVHLVKMDDILQGHAIIQVDEIGENCIIVYSGSNGSVDHEYIDNVLTQFDDETMLVLQNEISELEYVVNEAHKRGMTIVLNPSPLTESLKQIDLNKISWLIMNQVEAEMMSGCTETEAILDTFKVKYPDLNCVLTLGSKGSVCLYEGSIIEQVAFQTKAVDTTGAGDTFAGYFVAGMSRNKPIQEVLNDASKAAALCVSRYGAAPSIPYYKDLAQLTSFKGEKR